MAGVEVFWFLLLSLIAGASGLAVFIYFLKQGQFEDPEDPKYQMFIEDNAIEDAPEPPDAKVQK